jgi:hypothetical protein
MRNGYSDGSSDATFVNDEFHVVYHNGAGPECVSTRDPIRRGGFLLGRRDQVASPVTALIGRVFWFLSTPAVAASDYDYTQIRLNVFPFAADTGPRCLRFSVPKGTSEVDIDVSDIEKRAAILGLTPSGVSVRAHFSAH